jgi:RND family efflux transporter MFP subunit
MPFVDGMGGLALAFLLALLAPVFLVAGQGCHSPTPAAASALDDGDAPAGPKRVRCAPIEERILRDALEVHGTLAPLPDRDAQIAGQTAGRLLRVLVREGDRVVRGQPLAQIDAAALRDQVTQAGAQLAKARAESHLAVTSRDRIALVFERGIAARQELDDADGRVATAAASEAEVRASSEMARRQLERTTVRSPLSGVVLHVFRKSGELVDGTPATPILEVGDPSALELVGTATAFALVHMEPGDVARIEVPALPSFPFAGVVAAVSPAVDRSTGLGTVRVTLRSNGKVSPPVGLTATAWVEVGQPRRAVMVPAAALRAAIGARAELVICGADRRAHVVGVVRAGPGHDTTGTTTTAAAAAAVKGQRFAEIALPDGTGDDTGARPARPALAGALVAVEPVLGLLEGDHLDITTHD